MIYKRIAYLEENKDFETIKKISPTLDDVYTKCNSWKAFNAYYLSKLGLLPTESSFDNRNYSLSTVNVNGEPGFTVWKIDHTSTEQFEPTEEKQKELLTNIANRMFEPDLMESIMHTISSINIDSWRKQEKITELKKNNAITDMVEFKLKTDFANALDYIIKADAQNEPLGNIIAPLTIPYKNISKILGYD
ncbi:MAG: hypothetical protein KAS12_07365 [Candidatus Aenigmarchaeota archaeon]|nr:hypothetical protein [Candidatus Aenigmarchaeota archaeon]